jgi:hypothetical protein
LCFSIELSPSALQVWLVVFGTDWATKCATLAPLFAKLSVSGPADARRKWGRVDLAQVPPP